MPRFFIRAEQVSSWDNGARTITIRGEDAHHISRSLRMAAGEEITVCDMQKNVYVCKISGFSDAEVYADVVNQSKSDTEPAMQSAKYMQMSGTTISFARFEITAEAPSINDLNPTAEET